MSTTKQPLGMRPDEQTVIAHFKTSYQYEDKTETKSQNILFWGDYGYVMPSAITSNGNMFMVLQYMQDRQKGAAQLANELSCQTVVYSLEVLTQNGFIQVDFADQKIEDLAMTLLASAKVLCDAYNAEAAS